MAEKIGDIPVNPINPQGCISTGLTIREHFAGLAMQGILSSEYVSSFCKEDTVCPAAVSKAAVNYADALLMELS